MTWRVLYWFRSEMWCLVHTPWVSKVSLRSLRRVDVTEFFGTLSCLIFKSNFYLDAASTCNPTLWIFSFLFFSTLSLTCLQSFTKNKRRLFDKLKWSYMFFYVNTFTLNRCKILLFIRNPKDFHSMKDL